MADILIGTCGYSYNEWVGPVYPDGAKKDQFLSLYAGMFPTVELDFAFYAMPKAENLSRMLISGGADLTFAIKAFQDLTHKIDTVKWPDTAKKYIEAVSPLLEAHRLEAVLFQFPYSFHYTPENRRYLDKLLTCFRDIPIAVEFRGSDWYNGRVVAAMKERGIPLAALDLPDLNGLPPFLDVVTSKTAYIRLHGRNKESWWGSDRSSRYDYLYTEKEMETWAGRIERIVGETHRILVYFNNHPRGQAVKNARMLEILLRKVGLLQEGSHNKEASLAMAAS